MGMFQEMWFLQVLNIFNQIKFMQTYQLRDTNPEVNHLDKPMQRSVVIHNTFTPQNSTPTKFNNPMEQSPSYPILKKSTSTVINNSQHQNLNYSFISNSSGNANININSPSNKSPYQFKTINYLQNKKIKTITSLNNFRLHQAKSQNDLPRLNGQFHRQNRQRKNQQLDLQSIISKITQQMKEKHLPEMMRSFKQQIYDDFHALRFEFNNFKEQQKHINGKLNDKYNNSHSKQQQQEVNLSQTYLFLLQEKVNKLQMIFNQKYNKLNQKFQKQIQSLSYKSLNIDNILKPSTQNIKLQYRQSLIIKDHEDRQRINQEIIISLISYSIDRYGYLLDSENCYLLDNRGFQIKLEDKHLKLLEEYKILQK